MRALNYGLLSFLAVGCAITPREPYLWRDDAQPAGVHRADVARAEGRVIEYLVASGTMVPEEVNCGGSPRAYEVFTVETQTAYQVRVPFRPGLCHQAPEDTTLPPASPWEEWPMEFAVSKKDFHIIRERRQGDDAVDMVFEAPKAPPPAPSALAFTTSNSTVPVGACSGPVGVAIRAPAGSSQEVAAPITVNWAAVPPSAVFFSDATCTTAVTGTQVDAKASSAEIYFRATQVGPVQITASATGLTGASQTYSVEAARAVALAFTTPPQSVAKGICSSAVTLQAKDAFDNPASVASATPIQLVAQPAGGVSFYARPDCTGAAVTAVSIPANGSSTNFYLKGRRAGTVALSATLAAGSASQDAVITSDRPPHP